jgi:ER degradation enhancer, mannosidase alpha-like 2
MQLKALFGVALVVGFLQGTLIGHIYTWSQEASGHRHSQQGFQSTEDLPASNSSNHHGRSYPPPGVAHYRQEALEMFRFGYGAYMQHAFPKDALRPLSCGGHQQQGGIALTLIDSLDTLITLGEVESLRRAVHWLQANASFEVDSRVHIFELTIRAVGGLLSAHELLLADPTVLPDYSGGLLPLAKDLADRLMPGFDTPTKLPLSWVNLASGAIPGDTRETCTACAGTLILELGTLSRLTGDPKYEEAAAAALAGLFRRRSPLGLVGNTLNVDTGQWVRRDSGAGAGVDSFYEYLLKVCVGGGLCACARACFFLHSFPSSCTG